MDVALEIAPAQVAVGCPDFRGLKKLRDAAGERFTTGVVLYDGEDTVPFGEGLFAVPLSRIWTAGK